MLHIRPTCSGACLLPRCISYTYLQRRLFIPANPLHLRVEYDLQRGHGLVPPEQQHLAVPDRQNRDHRVRAPVNLGHVVDAAQENRRTPQFFRGLVRLGEQRHGAAVAGGDRDGIDGAPPSPLPSSSTAQ